MMMALRPLIAIIALLTGVAPGLVEGVMAQTTPTGLAYLMMPRFLSSSMMPTDLDPQQVAQRAEGLALLLDDLVRHVAELGVGDRELGELLGVRGIVERPGQRGDGFVGARLVGVGEHRHRRARRAAPVRRPPALRIVRRFHCHRHLIRSDHATCCGRMSSRLMPATTTGFFMASRRNGSPSS